MHCKQEYLGRQLLFFTPVLYGPTVVTLAGKENLTQICESCLHDYDRPRTPFGFAKNPAGIGGHSGGREKTVFFVLFLCDHRRKKK